VPDSGADLVARGYDAVYERMLASPTLWRLWKEHAAGPDFPDGFSHISFVTLAQIERMAGELRLQPGRTLIDVGCGLAGPALWVARRTGARLIGVDLSPVAVSGAMARAQQSGFGETATFAVGAFADTGVPDGVPDGIMSEDALQYAPDKRAAFAEAARILRPGGRFVFTAFELDAGRVAGLPVLGTDPVEDLGPVLEAAGFEVEAYEEVPGWPEPVTSAYTAVLGAREQLTAEMGETAFAALSSEMTVTLDVRPYRRRVLAVAAKR
jgi:SAM-dependent methyltransferase